MSEANKMIAAWLCGQPLPWFERQPAAPTFAHPGAEEVFQRLQSAREQPAAPTPERLHAEFCYPVCSGQCPWSEPAAPEPSAEPYGTQAHEGFSCADTELGRAAWMHRAESAEAQLAAVRRVRDKLLELAGEFRRNPQVHSTYYECVNRLDTALLTAPSPGAGGSK